MTIALKANQITALRKHAGDLAKKIGAPNFTEYDAKEHDARALQVHASEIRKAARKLLPKAASSNSDEAREIETAYDAAVDLLEGVDLEIALRGVQASEDGDEKRRAALRPNGGEVTAHGTDDGISAPYVSRSAWTNKDGDEIRVALPGEKLATPGAEYRGPGLGDTLRALIIGPRNDAEKRALSEGTDSAGGYTVPTPLASEFFDRLRAASVVVRAGARTVNMTSETLGMARLETDPTVTWRAENAEVTASDPTFGRVLLEAKSIAGLTKISRELMEDSVNVGAMLEMAFTKAMALSFDQAALYGTGVDNQPTGIGVLSGINSVSMGVNGLGLAGYSRLIDAIYEMQVDNAPDPTAKIMHPRTNRTLASMVDGDGNPLQVPEMVSKVPTLITTSVPINQTQGTATDASSIIFGHFPQMILGLRSSLRIEILKERYADHLQYGIIAHMRGDVQVVHKASFCKLIGIIQ
ncbi:MAG: phage major capsid protein [Beijerinckiaceae bacterium]|nr:phage major capsid protein [Beijerinckiaceae bacterium]